MMRCSCGTGQIGINMNVLGNRTNWFVKEYHTYVNIKIITKSRWDWSDPQREQVGFVQ